MWNFLPVLCFLGFTSLFFSFWEKGGEGGGGGGSTCPGLPPPTLDPPLINEYFIKLSVWLVVVGIVTAVDFVACFCA